MDDKIYRVGELMGRSTLYDDLAALMSRWAKKEGCGGPCALRDVLTDLMHIADDQDIDWFDVIEEASEVYEEELRDSRQASPD